MINNASDRNTNTRETSFDKKLNYKHRDMTMITNYCPDKASTNYKLYNYNTINASSFLVTV